MRVYVSVCCSGWRRSETVADVAAAAFAGCVRASFTRAPARRRRRSPAERGRLAPAAPGVTQGLFRVTILMF